METPECPVCLEPYNAATVVPRVLSCGHSVCELCLGNLAPQFPNTVRCPACTQLVPLSRPSALPRNFDLLSLVDAHPTPRLKEPKPRNPIPKKEFLPRRWDHEFYSTWKDHILPYEAVVMSDSIEGECLSSLAYGKMVCSRSFSSFNPNQQVTLLPVTKLSSDVSNFNLSYIFQVVEALYLMQERQRDDLHLLLQAGVRQLRLCNVYGLWMNLVNRIVFLVSERFEKNIYNILIKVNGGGENLVHSFALAAVEMCEGVMGLHCEGLVGGLFGLSCFVVDSYGRIFMDLNEIIMTGRKVRKAIAKRNKALNNVLYRDAFVAPELFTILEDKGLHQNPGGSIGFGSDVWSLACLFVKILSGEEFADKIMQELNALLPMDPEEINESSLQSYVLWKQKVGLKMEAILGSKLEPLKQTLVQCLDYNPGSRPTSACLWRCIQDLLIRPYIESWDGNVLPITSAKSARSLVLSEICVQLKAEENQLEGQNEDVISNDLSQVVLAGSDRRNDNDFIKGLSAGCFKSVTVDGHRDCITGLALGGGYLFSSSFDKTIQMWSLQDFSHAKSLRGHEHRVMAVVFVDAECPLCISGDSGGLICVWDIAAPHATEPLKKWSEHSDWRFSGIHSLAVSGNEYLYSGSGDKSIKAWSLQDNYKLVSTMIGHKSVVSCLAVCNGLLYSGSWDGTIRLWWVNDHSPLAVLGEDSLGNVKSVLSVTANPQILVASHEDGSVKMWKNDVLVRSTRTQESAVLSVCLVDRWLFIGGWNKKIDVQEFVEDDYEVDTTPVGTICSDGIVTAMLYWEGKLIVGCADRVIKVYHYDP